MRKNPEQPTHSQCGNPYPRGLKPVIIEYAPPGSNCMPQPLSEPEFPDEGSSGLVTDEYLYEQPDPKWPRLKLQLAPRGKRQTDEQYAAYRRGIEEFTCTHSIFVGLCQELCTLLGNHRTCLEGVCRRNGVCCGLRDQDRYWLPMLIFPPCVPLDLEIIETYRQEIIAEIKRARGKSV